MSLFKKTVFLVLLCFVSSTALATEQELWKKLNSLGGTFQPVFVTVNDGRAVIILEQDSISLNFILASVPAVICSPGEGKNYFKSVEEVAILNKTGSQGYVLMGGKETCEEIYSSGEYSDTLIRAHLKPHNI